MLTSKWATVGVSCVSATEGLWGLPMLSGVAVQNGPFRRSFVRASVKDVPTRPDGLAGAIAMLGTRKWFTQNSEIYGEKEPADYFCKVVRAYKVVIDGRRLVGAFYLPGDIFGLEAGDRHLFSTEAVVDSEILVVKRDAVTSLAARNNEVARDLWTLTAAELQRTQNHMLLLNKSASERVASFLLEMAERIRSDHEIQLAMSRQDVADYLGLTSETISRMLTRLETACAIALPNCRRIVLRDRPVLKRMVA
jgi:CRP/FNR family transcriptional regulator, nitrogen fixation regulation protein